MAQLVERVLGKDEVLGSNPSGSSWVRLTQTSGVTSDRTQRSAPGRWDGPSGTDHVDVWGGWAGSRRLTSGMP